MKHIKSLFPIFIILIFTFSQIGLGSIYGNSYNCETRSSKIILLTGFEAFGIYNINPSQLIVENLSGQIINGAEIIGIILPVDFEESEEIAAQAIEQYKPIIVLSLGLSPKTEDIDVEKFAINIMRCPIDNDTWSFPKRIDKKAPLIRFSQFKVAKTVKNIESSGIPAHFGYFAGTYVCNYLFYQTLGYVNKNCLSIDVGFIHVPLLDSQDPAGMKLDLMIEAVTITLETCTS